MKKEIAKAINDLDNFFFDLYDKEMITTELYGESIEYTFALRTEVAKPDLLNPVIETCIHTRCNNFQSKGSKLCSSHIKEYSR